MENIDKLVNLLLCIPQMECLTPLQKEKLKNTTLLRLHCIISTGRETDADGKFRHDLSCKQFKEVQSMVGILDD